MKTLAEKKASPYKVKSLTHATKDVDLSKRTVTGLFNSCYFIDEDLDMVLPGAATKSINERGVGSTKGNKIKHLKDHNWTHNIARLDVLDERKVEINGKEITGIYHESYYPQTTDSTDLLIKIQEKMYDSRSIGYQYVNLVLCQKQSENEDNVRNWDLYLPLAMNPEVAEEYGHFWVVKELMLWEGSDVTFAANALTPMLGIKGANKDAVINELFTKIDYAHSLMKSGNLSDEGFHQLDMEIKQIKAYIADISTNEQPLKQSTPPFVPSRKVKDTDSGTDFLKALTKF